MPLAPRCGAEALHSPGWEHVVDGLLRFFLCQFPWFSSHLRDLKHLARLMNIHYLGLAECLENVGKRGTTQVLRSMSVSSFAHWRWGTICKVSKDCGVVQPILKDNLHHIETFFCEEFATPWS